jgi:serine/threonine protein kinase
VQVELREIGRGGFGAVYAAKHATTGEWVAIKVQKAKPARHRRRKAHEQADADGFEQEIRLLKRLQHDNIVKYIDTLTIQAASSSSRHHSTQAAQRCVVLE